MTLGSPAHNRAALLAPALLMLAACGSTPPGQAPLSEAALAAVTADGGAPKDQLARSIDDLFAMPGLGETRAVVVMANGKLAAERYGPGYSKDTRFVSWSMAKTVTGVLIGMLVADGKLSLDAPAPVPLWQRPGDPRAEITLRQLLQMRSGLRHTEAGDPPYESSEVRMLFLDGRDNMAKWAEEQPLEAEPGKQFEYSSNTSVILADIAARALTASTSPDARRKAVAGYLQERLFGPLGMTSMVPEFDASGTLIGGSLMHASARDWAKLGEFLRLKGRAPGGEQLVPQRWVEAMVTPSPRSPHYGFQTWLNRPIPGTPASEHPLFPDRAPQSLFSLIGHMGQYVLVSPSQRVTLVRLGHSDSTQRPPMLQQAADILELYPVR
ncbi:CubicO group peptidase (beta-lactamase class C family) [Erythromicrobium ramosum]|uniref:CubicO group peptidase (Beta-lactamase class C family) n=1 Tax=Erythrobacter ramosus TaxID=35811 RepID=A0A6I4UGK4_9SPHN|nr:serine hydrolase [Erythrobacter ramosus]MBB3774730.1 CubicO group peptidase (beta-lactamase class C family) [Erythrobacter ramosus]MXP37626.1 serine hydrolase [Erythrobacter ramosus]